MLKPSSHKQIVNNTTAEFQSNGHFRFQLYVLLIVYDYWNYNIDVAMHNDNSAASDWNCNVDVEEYIPGSGDIVDHIRQTGVLVRARESTTVRRMCRTNTDPLDVVNTAPKLPNPLLFTRFPLFRQEKWVFSPLLLICCIRTFYT